jgi:DNA-binding response OmpR family regulator
MPNSQQILFVSDETLHEVARAELEQRGFGVESAPDFDNAYRRLHTSAFDLVIVDVTLAASGAEFVKRLRATPELNKIFVLTIADWGTGQATLALTAGADAYEPKPVSPERLMSAVERLLRKRIAKTAAATKGIKLETDA